MIEYFDPEKVKEKGANLKKEFKVKKSTPKKRPATPRNLKTRSVISSYSNQKPDIPPLRKEKITRKPSNKLFAKLKPEKIQLYLKSEICKEDIRKHFTPEINVLEFELAAFDEVRTARAEENV